MIRSSPLAEGRALHEARPVAKEMDEEVAIKCRRFMVAVR
jgi:hypothetical protein